MPRLDWGRDLVQAAAWRAVRAALADGTLVRPERCECCGAEHPNLVPHHDDYSAPLRVRWLTPSHHSRLHARQRLAARRMAGVTA